MNVLAPLRARIGPWNEMEGVQERMNRLFGLTPGFFAEEPMEWAPAVNLMEADDEFVLTAELPGLKSEDVQVDIEDNVLALRGEKRTEKEEKASDGRWYLAERSYGAFHRSFTLPRSVESDKIEADFKDGVLTVHLPKRKESMARKIDVGKK